jgi:hypothetical protein
MPMVGMKLSAKVQNYRKRQRWVRVEQCLQKNWGWRVRSNEVQDVAERNGAGHDVAGEDFEEREVSWPTLSCKPFSRILPMLVRWQWSTTKKPSSGMVQVYVRWMSPSFETCGRADLAYHRDNLSFTAFSHQ